MDQWEYRTIRMYLEAWQRMNEKYEDYVVTYADGVRVEGIEALFRHYLDEGGWDLVTIVPTSFRHSQTTYSLTAETLTVIFRRKLLIP